MDIATTTQINALDLINLSKDIAELNLGYLGISVAILGVLGGVFVYFNIRPLHEKLSKQEEALNNLRKEAGDLLGQSDIQTASALKDFEDHQVELLSTAFDQQKENIYLEVINKIQVAENNILEKADAVSGDKDLKLKEILLSEMSNKILSMEKTLAATFEENKKQLEDKFSVFERKIDSRIKEISNDVLELKAYKYDMEGRMGGIIFTIEALEKCEKEEPHLLRFKIEDLKEKIGKYTLTPDLFIRLRSVLKSIESKNPEHLDAIKEIRDQVRLQEKPEM